MLEIPFGSAVERKRFVASLLLSLVVLMGGLVCTYRIGLRANLTAHTLGHVQEDVEAASAAGAHGGAR